MAGLLASIGIPLLGQGISWLVDKIRGSHDGAKRLRKNEVVLLHKNEMVLPADVRAKLMQHPEFRKLTQKLPNVPKPVKRAPKKHKAKKPKKKSKK